MEILREKILEICQKEIIPLWKEQRNDFPTFFETKNHDFPKIEKEQKAKNEKLLEELFQGFQKAFTKNPKGESEETAWKQETNQLLASFLEQEQILQIDQYMDVKTFGAFEREMKSFVRQARAFDQNLTMNQIWQAMRNYMIYSMIVEMQGEEQEARKPIFSYSLLYPYTDNFIDDIKTSKQSKEHFNRLIADKILGKEVQPQSLLEEKTCQLLDGILHTYAQQAQVMQTLLLLLEAQNDSIGQQRKKDTKLLTTEEILEISVYKGSTSVLADYLFSTEDWKEEEALFYMKLGFLLQLVDDLQDITEDEKGKNCTLMTKAKQEGQLEQCVNQLLWFIETVIGSFHPKSERLKPFVSRHCIGISMIAAGMNPEFFSKEYLEQLEVYLPFSLAFLKKLHKKQGQKELAQNKAAEKVKVAKQERAGAVNNKMRLLDLLVEE